MTTATEVKTLVVDADGHVMEPGETLWVDRMDKDKWGDWIPSKEVVDEIYEIHSAGGQVRGGGKELHDQMAAAVGLSPRELWDLTWQLRVEGGYDPDARVAQLDQDGVDATVMYPSQALFFGPVDPAAVDALFRTDLDLKTSGGDPRVLLERLVVELCASNR